ncbi:hypothetical protein MHSWG343_00580 [Candidatus Mycoplasma haematohominis]|uniref:Uncharacterized protein n=1 Tax=Candidatus Mycoplasma haematohominis TaxID=1494318 RepID=A0A478FSU8_9MOLU|nr:hypothetical protein MHSWG343_00580 [Candidatus Mycoplasma haemohominis]
MSKDFKFAEVYTDVNWIGKNYGHYLVAPVGEKGTGAERTSNEAWWKWSYERRQQDSQNTNITLSDEFSKVGSKVSKAFSDSDTESDSSTALNKVCEVVYKKNKDFLSYEGNSSDSKTKLKNDLWKYCSILGEVKTIIEVGEKYDDNTRGKDDTNSKKFIAITGNDKFWEIRNEEFYKNSGDKSRSKTTGTSSKFKTDSADSKKLSIKDICKEAYKSKTSEDASYPSSEINIFCVL